MRIAWVIAWRTTGSPERETSMRRTEAKSPSRFSREITRPVSIKAHVEALTKRDSDRPRWRCQSAPPILSLISRSAVSASGIRSSASARHISTTPLAARQLVFLHEGVDAPGAHAPAPHLAHESAGQCGNALEEVGRQCGGARARGDARRLVHPVVGAERGA